jgi:hypothetical protein
LLFLTNQQTLFLNLLQCLSSSVHSDVAQELRHLENDPYDDKNNKEGNKAHADPFLASHHIPHPADACGIIRASEANRQEKTIGKEEQ